MSERKVLQKYFPSDFDPSALKRTRKPKNSGPRIQPVRLMAPFSMQCTSCGEFIHKGRKFNARKETPDDERYLGIQIFRFYIRCTRCSAEIVFRTDPKNQDYTCERGAKRSIEVWAKSKQEREETDEERLDRLQREEDEEEEAAKQDKMVELEAKRDEAKREMAVGDALDEIRMRNARMEIAHKEGVEVTVGPSLADEARLAEEREDAEAARRAFAFAKEQDALLETVPDDDGWEGAQAAAAAPRDTMDMPPPPKPAVKAGEKESVPAAASTFKRQVKKKKDHASLLGIKKKPALV